MAHCNLDRLESCLRSLLPETVAVAGAVSQPVQCLSEQEREGIAKAVPARQREFAGGRHAAKLAQARLGLAPASIPIGQDRAPCWPAGLRGSITHSRGLCLAAVTDSTGIGGLGIDLEPDSPLPSALLTDVLVAEEHAYPAVVVFSAKEAVFKALYPRLGFTFGFDSFCISLKDSHFLAKSRRPLGSLPAGAVVTGRYALCDGMVVSAVSVQPF